MDKKHLTFRQIKWWFFVAIFLITVPYIWVILTTPPDLAFTKTLVNPDDTSVYLSAIRQGQEGNWLFHFQFSPETIAPKFMYVLYLFIGHLSSWIGGEIIFWFHFMRLLFVVLALFGALFWVRAALPNHARQQATAWFLIIFGGGFGWLAAIFAQTKFYDIPELGRGGWGVMMPFMATPHFALGITLTIWFFTSLLWVTRSNHLWIWGLTAIFGVLLGLVYPYMIPVLGLVTGLYLLIIAWQNKRIPWNMWIFGGCALLAMVPLLLYYGYFAQQDPVWALTHVQDNNIPPPAIWAVIISLGLMAPFAVVGMWFWLKQNQNSLIPLWAVVQFLSFYLPFPYSGRFILGWTVPVYTLAAYGLEQGVLPWLWKKGGGTYFSRISKTPYPTARRLILILTLPSTILVILFFIQIPAVKPEYPIFLPQADMQAISWLAEKTTQEDLILANYPVGNYLPRETSAHVFIGQPFLTLDLPGKFSDLSKFWQEETEPTWRERFLSDWEVTHIYYGTYEQELTTADVIPPGQLIYDADGIKIYEFREPKGN
jgi:hypothetical protein